MKANDKIGIWVNNSLRSIATFSLAQGNKYAQTAFKINAGDSITEIKLFSIDPNDSSSGVEWNLPFSNIYMNGPQGAGAAFSPALSALQTTLFYGYLDFRNIF